MRTYAVLCSRQKKGGRCRERPPAAAASSKAIAIYFGNSRWLRRPSNSICMAQSPSPGSGRCPALLHRDFVWWRWSARLRYLSLCLVLVGEGSCLIESGQLAAAAVRAQQTSQDRAHGPTAGGWRQTTGAENSSSRCMLLQHHQIQMPHRLVLAGTRWQKGG